MGHSEPAAEPFSAFMRRALFDSDKGYYSRRISGIGRRGDFSTASSASAILGKAIAGWIVGEARRLRSVRSIIEIGGGSGQLMAEIRKSLGWWWRRKFDFHMVETSPALQSQQAELLGGRVSWHHSLRDGLMACGGRVIIYHNELLDAFPVDLIQWDAAKADWMAIWLGHARSGARVEQPRPLEFPDSEREQYSVLREWNSKNPPPSDAQRCELHTDVRRWLRGWAPFWKSGVMLSIDYGEEFPSLYHRRPRGTLRAFLLHQRLEGGSVYQNPGRQDITADVNFTDYRAWCANLGWQEAFCQPLHRFLHCHAPECSSSADHATHFLTDAEGAGSAFKCVSHRCGAA